MGSDIAPHRWWVRFVMRRQSWWLPTLLVLLVGVVSMVYVGRRTYVDAPPVPDFVSADGRVVVSHDDAVRGQIVFEKYALMDYGTLFGDGAERGPDFTADALHQGALAAVAYYAHGAAPGTPEHDAALARVAREYKSNRWDASRNTVVLSDGQVAAYLALLKHYRQMFAGAGSEAMHPTGYIRSEAEIHYLTGFLFWGAWTCAAERPGRSYSYTQNWPYDDLVGNSPSAPVMYWSIFAVLGLMLALGLVLHLYGRYGRNAGWSRRDRQAPETVRPALDAQQPTRLQRLSYYFFAVAIGLFALQVLAGFLTLQNFLYPLSHVLGVDIARYLPITVARSWHLQLALLWITACWAGATLFLIPVIHRPELRGQVFMARLMLALLVLVVAGMLVGVWLGPLGILGSYWSLLGNQGWEYVELGKLWQGVLLVVFVIWAALVGQAVVRVWHKGDAWILPKWLFYVVACIALLFLSAFVAKPTTNFVIADFWRWAVIHMWAEAFFEVFTTVLVAYVMYLAGFVSHATASRLVYFATLLFLGSGLLGISHNFYWNAKPVATLAIGSIFSTLQVVPLVLLTLEAWGVGSKAADAAGSHPAARTQSEALLFLAGVSLWNFLGAGVFGFIINLPIVNYYEHGTYLTVNHAHAALFGVYGNLALASLLFCARYLLPLDFWPRRLIRRAFWCFNIGLALMLAFDLLPAGVLQLVRVLELGLAGARSQAFVYSGIFQALTWARLVGAAAFVLGGVLPMCWFVLKGVSRLDAAALPGAPQAAQRNAGDSAEPVAECGLEQ